MKSREMEPDVARTVERFSAPETVVAYAGLPSLQGGEEFLFSRHLRAGIALLDLGVGAGRTTHFLQPTAQRYVGVDISSSMLEAARSAYPGVDFRLADASDLGQFPDQSFDAVIFSFNGLGCVFPDASRVKCLAECSRVLKAGGVFIFSLHNARSIFLRPGRRGPGLSGVLHGVVAGILDNVARVATRLPSHTFWRGRGWYETSAHGGIKVFATIPRLAVKEVEGQGFNFVECVPEDHPRPAQSLVTRWYYYAFVRK